MNELIGGRIKELRDALGYTQEYIADSIGVSRQKYGRIENGTNSASLDVLSKIADVLKTTVGNITSVLDEQACCSFRHNEEVSGDGVDIIAMVDLLYANKYLYDQLQK